MLTRRATLAGAAALVSTPALPASPRKSYDLVPKQVALDLWMIEGSTEYFTDENGGAIVNVVLAGTDAGLVIVDTGTSLRFGQALSKVAQGLSGRGVAAIINTHHHPDHFFGNQAFHGVPVYALPTTRIEAQTHGDGFADGLYRILGDWMRGTEPRPPDTDISATTLSFGGRKFEVLSLSGHTAADLALVDTATGTLIAGDLCFLNRAPTTPTADLTVWQQSLDLIEAAQPAGIIPGHGPLDRTGASISQTRAYLSWLARTLQAAADQGLDMVEVMAADLPAEYAGMGAQPQEFIRSVSHLFPTFEQAALPLAD